MDVQFYRDKVAQLTINNAVKLERDNRMTIMVHPIERQMIEDWCQELGMSVSAFVRNVILEHIINEATNTTGR